MAEPTVAETPPGPAHFSVRVLRDFWRKPNDDGTENRVRAGEIITVALDDAFAGIETGAFERYKGE